MKFLFKVLGAGAPFLCGLLTVGFIPASPVNAAQECRTAALPDGTPAMFCKDKKGNWKQQEGKIEVAPSAPVAPAAPLVKAEGKYQGTYEVVAKIQPRNRQRRGLSDVLSGAVNDALNTKTERESGGISIALNFDGPSVTAQVSGSTLRSAKLVGLVQNGNCVLNNSGGEGFGSVRYEGPCGAQGFSGKIAGTTERNINYTGTFQTTVISFTDNSQKETKRAELAAKCDGGRGSMSACVELEQQK